MAVSGSVQIGTSFEFTSGTLQGSGVAEMEGPMTMSGGMLQGALALNVQSNLVWTGGTMQGAGTTQIGTNGVLTLGGAGDKGLHRVLSNRGQAVWSGGRLLFYDGVFNNRVGAVFEIQCDQPFYDGVLNNEGTVVKGAGTGTTAFANYWRPPAPLHNRGVVEVRSGTLQLNGTDTHTGSFVVATNATLQLANGTHTLTNGIAFGGLGTVRVQGPLQLGANVDFGTLVVIFEGSASVSGAYAISNAAGGTITFGKSMTVPGSMTIAGTLALASSGLTVTIQGTLTLEATGVVNNPGTLRVGAFADNGGTVNGNAPVEVGLGGKSLQLRLLECVDPSAAGPWTARSVPAVRQVVLTWSGEPAQEFVVEVSGDLQAWQDSPTPPSELAHGRYEARWRLAPDSQAFFRVRVADPADTLGPARPASRVAGRASQIVQPVR
jgi:hypothetical protein